MITNPHRRKRSKNYRRRKSHAKNPFFSFKKKSHSRRRRHNPGIGGFSFTELAKLGVGSAGGFIGSRYLAQMLLGDNNTGIIGYATNAALAIALAWATEKVSKDKTIASGVAAGGLGGVFARIWSENVSGTAVVSNQAANNPNQLGDAEFSGNGLGAYTSSDFPLPTVSSIQPGSNYLTPRAAASMIAGGPAPTAPAGTAGPSGVARFRGDRLGYQN